jgi:hypothetical protein
VSLTVDDGKPRVTSIASAPGLGEAQLERYRAAIMEFSEEGKPRKRGKKESAAAKIDPEVAEAPAELLARVTRKLHAGGLSKDRVEEALKVLEA